MSQDTLLDEGAVRRAPTPYKGAYHDQLDDPDEDTAAQEDENQDLSEDDDTPEAKTPEETVWKQRYGDLKSYHDRSLAALKKEIDELKKSNETVVAEALELPKSDDELETWKREYPDVYATVETIASKVAAKRQKELEAKLSDIEKRENDVYRKQQAEELQKLHPDLPKLDRDDLADWARNQPEEIQDWLYRSIEAKLVARAIDLYKADRGITAKTTSEQKKKRREDAAKSVSAGKVKDEPRGTEKRIWKESEILAKSKDPTWFEKHEAEIDEAGFEGRIEFDVTKQI